jgi:hypothetical protein
MRSERDRLGDPSRRPGAELVLRDRQPDLDAGGELDTG